MNNDEENAITRKRRLAKERKDRWLAKQSQESLAKIRAVDLECHRKRIETETPDQRTERLASHTIAQQKYLDHLTPTETNDLRISNAASHQRHIEAMSQQELTAHQEENLAAHHRAQLRHSQAIRNEAIHFDESQVQEHYCGPLNVLCEFCKAKHFRDELPSDKKFTDCCRKGKIKLPKPKDEAGNELKYPEFLQNLLSDVDNPNRSHFRDEIRSYNCAISFASMGAKIVDVPGRGDYVFKIHGQTYHRTSHLNPINDESPEFAQLYVLDSTQATDIRQHHAANENCRREILDKIDRFFRQQNRLVKSYKLMRDIEAQETTKAIEAGEEIPIVNMVLNRDRQLDQRRYNAPTCNEVAMIFVNDDGEPPFNRDIRIYPKNPDDPNQKFINLNILSPNMDPMTYALFFPYGEPGWQPNWQCDSYEGADQNKVRKNISMLQYKTALTAIRDDFNPIISAGKLTQQWVVDSFLQVEANNLNFIRHNQKRLRTECYQGLSDHMDNLAQNQNMAAGIPVILPSSFEGSPRNMRERCCDAMSIFAKHGPPDLFITFTANPKWREITENLKPGESSSDRPDLVARVFKIKLDALLNDVLKHGIFGNVIAYVYTIEFQKRGLPHSHILVTLSSEDKFTTVQRVDQFISAEIPSTESPKLREIVLKCMTHGPCGNQNPNSPCMKDGQCSKQFPKAYNENTILNVNGYPLYRRRANESALVRGKNVDSRNIVPYNPYLTLKYNAHINVEVATSIRFVKYIYKYIFKGFDCATVSIVNGQPELRLNEISNFIDCRYVSAPEAIWRLRECKMHDRSHTVMRLPVHLPNQQRILFEEGHEEEALLAAQTNKTKLERWFELNTNDHEARQYLYTEISYHYTYVHGQWQKRKRGGDKIVARMYTVSVKDEERFYLRMLLLHVPGATSFELLRTVDNTIYETFKAAAIARRLLESDDEWNQCLTDGGTYLMPKQLREMFAYICIFCQPAQPLKLWRDHLDNLILDYLRFDNEETSINKALHDLEFILKQHSMSCSSIGLPMPRGVGPQEEMYDQAEESLEAATRIKMLNEAQLAAFLKIKTAVEENSEQSKLFFLDGPGGTGKTFVYETILAYFRGEGKIVLPFATTGIAATNLKGGRTVHSGFKLPVPLLDTSVSSMRMSSHEAKVLRDAVLIVIDEITMLPKNGLRCIDKLLKEIMKSDIPFGGKVLVVGGDFRQTLPVVVRGTRSEIIECCIKSSPMWKHFSQLSLTINMRSAGQIEHNQWLLNVGSGKFIRTPELYEEDTIQIPNHMISSNDPISTIFDNIEQMQVENLSKRVIVAPTNAQTLEMNRKIIHSISGEAKIYYSADSMMSEDPNDALNFPTEFLNDQAPSGMPPHVLLLKKGVIVMLLRNLNPKKGLCNGTRLIIEDLNTNFIKAKIISECNKGDTVLIPRIDLAPSETTLPFILKRRQFPIIPAYAITINKSQGQSFDHVGIYLETAVFSHGQLYVALSRSRIASQVKVFITPNPQQGQLLNDERQFTRNIVYSEIL